MDYTVHGILQARILEWVAFPFLLGLFPTQGSSPGLLNCRWILYQLSHKGRPLGLYSPWKSPGQNTGVGSLSLSPADLSDPGIKSNQINPPALQADSLPTELWGKPIIYIVVYICQSQSPNLSPSPSHLVTVSLWERYSFLGNEEKSFVSEEKAEGTLFQSPSPLVKIWFT